MITGVERERKIMELLKARKVWQWTLQMAMQRYSNFPLKLETY